MTAKIQKNRESKTRRQVNDVNIEIEQDKPTRHVAWSIASRYLKLKGMALLLTGGFCSYSARPRKDQQKTSKPQAIQ